MKALPSTSLPPGQPNPITPANMRSTARLNIGVFNCGDLGRSGAVGRYKLPKKRDFCAGGPSIWFHFHPFPFTNVSFPSPPPCRVISLRSFFCAHVGAALSMYARVYIYTRFQVRLPRSCAGCPCAFGFPFIATTYTCLVSFPLIVFFLLCARADAH